MNQLINGQLICWLVLVRQWTTAGARSFSEWCYDMLCRWVLIASYWGASEDKARLGVFSYTRGTEWNYTFTRTLLCWMIFDIIMTHTHICMNQTLGHCHAGEIWSPRLVAFRGFVLLDEVNRSSTAAVDFWSLTAFSRRSWFADLMASPQRAWPHMTRMIPPLVCDWTLWTVFWRPFAYLDCQDGSVVIFAIPCSRKMVRKVQTIMKMAHLQVRALMEQTWGCHCRDIKTIGCDMLWYLPS